MRVLVTGGAGYIGSIAVEQLIAAGHQVSVIDSLERGHQEAVHREARFHQIDLRDASALAQIVRQEGPDAVVHFAGLIVVPESVGKPQRYYQVNTGGTANLLQAMQEAGVPKIVFSSTAAVYGDPERIPVQEFDRTLPLNPYGQSKLMVEQMLADAAATTDLQYVAFRYFNVAGASVIRGESHEPETHLIPAILETAAGKRNLFHLFGDDYPTTDGTAIRDYVHVLDLVDAHILALKKLDTVQGPINLGTSSGFSVRQIIEAVEAVTGVEVPLEIHPRRPGDSPRLVADTTRARELLGWEPVHSNLDEIIGTAWTWMQAHPEGYRPA